MELNESKPIENAIIYGRISKDRRTKEQKKDDNSVQGSLDVQEEACVKYADYKGFNVAATIADDGTTGDMYKVAFDKRKGAGQVKEMIETRRNGETIKHLVVLKLDRLGRRAEHLLGIMRWLDEKGVTLHIVNMGGDTITTSGATGRLMMTMLAAFAEFELESIRTRTRERLQAKFDAGESICKAVYGWDKVDSGRYTIKDEKKHIIYELVPNESELKWIRFMRDMRNTPCPDNRIGDGQHTGYNRIADELNRMGVPTKFKGEWSAGMVRRILTCKHAQKL